MEEGLQGESYTCQSAGLGWTLAPGMLRVSSKSSAERVASGRV